MKKTFTIKLDTQFTIDFTTWGLTDAQQRGENETRRLVIDQFLEQCGMDEFEIEERSGNSLFEAMAEVVKFENEAFLIPKNELEYTI